MFIRRTVPPGLLLSFWLILSFCTHPLVAQALYDSLDAKLSAIYQQDRLPGLSVVMVNKKGVLYQKNWGYVRLAEQQVYSNHTIQNIGSVSKTFIAAALMKAIEQGYFTLETDINTILPFPVINPNVPQQPIKIKHLVMHTSGIIDNEAIYLKTYLFDTTGVYSKPAYHLLKQKGYTGGMLDTSLSAFMYAYLSQKGNLYGKANFAVNPPGTSYHYSNIASALAGYLIEVKTGMSFATYTQKYILAPLQMTHSGWYLHDIDQTLHANLYYNREQALPFYSEITYPDGSLRTCTADMSKYLIEMIKGYQGTSSLLTRASFQAMFQPQFSATNYPEGIAISKRNKGVFWNIYNSGIISQDGDDPGVSTYLFFNVKTGVGGFLWLINTSTKPGLFRF
ncbi:serine hydrolase domain-containing protein [Adhaeribacter radiodurans]|uniref:Serine hydrolase n=1 Tax=Adhaeribacter radiodurans TaxID=2745197 RepID=A0A7L7LFA6_9BACT|nr:serine hydrolase [Adhaeribacter radiodurans]QMU31374.1 serine hydrolase [Adhaeribacter radiodurans]